MAKSSLSGVGIASGGGSGVGTLMVNAARRALAVDGLNRTFAEQPFESVVVVVRKGHPPGAGENAPGQRAVVNEAVVGGGPDLPFFER